MLLNHPPNRKPDAIWKASLHDNAIFKGKSNNSVRERTVNNIPLIELLGIGGRMVKIKTFRVRFFSAEKEIM